MTRRFAAVIAVLAAALLVACAPEGEAPGRTAAPSVEKSDAPPPPARETPIVPQASPAADSAAAATGEAGEPEKELTPMEKLRKDALSALAELEGKIADAAKRGTELPYSRATAYCARVALKERWERYEGERKQLGEWALKRCAAESARVGEILAGSRKAPVVPPVADVEKLSKLKRSGWYWVDPQGKPELLLSFHTTPPEELKEFFVPWCWSTWVSGVGGSRFDFRSAPIWEAYQKNPETHRVYGGGWCGHIIRDKWSMGGEPVECIICLESPITREAVAGYIEKKLPDAMKQKGRLISLLDYEYFYVCYCDYTKRMFRDYLRAKYGEIARLCALWGKEYGSFDEVDLPPMTVGDSNDRPDGAFNAGQVYDFYEFNLRRFADYMKWAKSVQRKIDPDCAMATCAPHYNFTSNFGESGSDVELMARQVNDILLNESGPSTKYVDFLRSISPEPKPVMDVESSALTNLLAAYLHGEAAVSIYWGWSAQPSGRAGDRIPFGDSRGATPMDDVERMLRTALDIRRLAPEITALATGVEAKTAILYSRASLLQVPQHAGNKTAYLMELESAYNAMLETGRAADFITSTQVLEGKLADYSLLVVPAATYEEEKVCDRVMEFASTGGAVLLVPNSFFFDEYARRREDYLRPLGIEVEKMRAPEMQAGRARTGIERDRAGEETEAPFIMGLIIDTVRTNVPKSKILAAAGSTLAKLGELRGAGVRHWLKAVPEGASVLATFDSGEPALVEIPRGKGRVYYLAQSLETPSYAALLAEMLRALGDKVALEVASPDGSRAPGVEWRSLRRKDGRALAFVNNLTRREMRVTLSSDRPIRRVRNLSLGEDAGAELRLPPLECWILEIETK